MTDPEQPHWHGCATEGGPAHYECAVKEIAHLRAQIKQWASAIKAARAVSDVWEQLEAEITRLRAENKELRAVIAGKVLGVMVTEKGKPS